MVNCSQRTFTYSHSVYMVWGQRWRQQTVRVHCDNAAVVEVIRAGYAKDPHLMQLLRCVFFITAFFETKLLPVHVPGVTNTVADAISRNNMDAFHSQVPGATPTVIPPEVMDLLVRRCLDWTSQAWAWWFRNWLQQA